MSGPKGGELSTEIGADHFNDDVGVDPAAVAAPNPPDNTASPTTNTASARPRSITRMLEPTRPGVDSSCASQSLMLIRASFVRRHHADRLRSSSSRFQVATSRRPGTRTMPRANDG